MKLDSGYSLLDNRNSISRTHQLNIRQNGLNNFNLLKGFRATDGSNQSNGHEYHVLYFLLLSSLFHINIYFSTLFLNVFLRRARMAQ